MEGEEEEMTLSINIYIGLYERVFTVVLAIISKLVMLYYVLQALLFSIFENKGQVGLVAMRVYYLGFP